MDGKGWQGMGGDGGGLLRTAGDGGDYEGRQGTARVMSHDVTHVRRIRLEVYDFSLASAGGLMGL